MDNDLWIGLLAGALSTGVFVPQAWKIWSSRRARDISWPTYAALSLAGLLWIAHGIALADPALIATNAIIVLVSCGILAMKKCFDG